jgi:hypothetical protein
MRKTWSCKIAGCLACLVLLMAWAANAAAQSARGSLRVTANVVTSTAVIFNNDGTMQILTANGPNGFSVQTVNLTVVPGQVTTLGSQTVVAAAPQPQGNQPAQPVIPH